LYLLEYIELARVGRLFLFGVPEMAGKKCPRIAEVGARTLSGASSRRRE